jgi:hypothetical protein
MFLYFHLQMMTFTASMILLNNSVLGIFSSSLSLLHCDLNIFFLFEWIVTLSNCCIFWTTTRSKGNSKWVVHEFGIYLQSNRTSRQWCTVIFWLNILHKPYVTYLTFLFCICQNKLHTQLMMSPKNKIILHHMGDFQTNNWLIIY